jgi:seryl-tRNA(Sec) selenium transferase
MLDRPGSELRAEAGRLAASLADVPGLTATVADDVAYVGSGSAPDEGLPSATVRLAHRTLSADDLALGLRRHVPAVFARLADRQVVIDLRTLREGETELVATAVRRVLESDHG